MSVQTTLTYPNLGSPTLTTLTNPNLLPLLTVNTGKSEGGLGGVRVHGGMPSSKDPNQKPQDTVSFWNKMFPKLSPCAQTIVRLYAMKNELVFEPDNLCVAMRWFYHDRQTVKDALFELSRLKGIWIKRELDAAGKVGYLCIMKKERLHVIQEVLR